MHGSPVRALAVVLVALVAACSQANPLFLPASGDDATPTSSASTTPASTSTSADTGDDPGPLTTDPDTGLEGSASGGLTTGPEPGTTTTTSGTTDLDPIASSSSTATADTGTSEPAPDSSTGQPLPDTSTGEGDTGEPPNAVDIVASLATCVLVKTNVLLHIGPDECEALAEQADGLPQTGVMILDTSYDGAGEREARVFLRFPIPATPPGLIIADVALTVYVSPAPAAAGPWAGALYKVTPFDANTLKVAGPFTGKLFGDSGPAVPGQPSHWSVPLEEIVPKQNLYLGLHAINSDGVLFRSSRAEDELKPTLTITYQ